MNDPAGSEISVGGAIIGQRSAPQVHRRGRVCADPECQTQLSIYNESPYCSVHTACPDCRDPGHHQPVTQWRAG